MLNYSHEPTINYAPWVLGYRHDPPMCTMSAGLLLEILHSTLTMSAKLQAWPYHSIYVYILYSYISHEWWLTVLILEKCINNGNWVINMSSNSTWTMNPELKSWASYSKFNIGAAYCFMHSIIHSQLVTGFRQQPGTVNAAWVFPNISLSPECKNREVLVKNSSFT